MSLNLALNNAISGLHINQEALAVLSQNIANVNTEGYTRKQVEQSPLYVNGVGNGVLMDDVTRKVDVYLQRALQTQNAEVGRSAAIQDYYDRIQNFLGQPGATNSMDSYLTGFFNAYQQMADTSEQISYRSNVVNAANALAQHVFGVAYNLNDLRFQADQDIQAGISSVNNSLRKLYDINRSIGRASGGGASTAGLLDERDMALEEISKQMDIIISYDNDGRATITSNSGAALLDGQLHQLSYTGASSADSFINDNQLGAITVFGLNEAGERVGAPNYLSTADISDEVTTTLTSGKIRGLIEVRDSIIPNILSQVDMLAAHLRDAVNALHNDGSGFPAAETLDGTRAVYAQDRSDWLGSVRIAVLGVDGQPVGSGYDDEDALRPLTLNLASLNDGENDGYVSMQTLVNEINDYFGAPSVKTQVGNLNNIQLVSDVSMLPSGASNLFDFDFQLDNASGETASFFVQGMTVLDDTGTDITNVTQNVPSISLATSGTYTTTSGSSSVQISLTSTTGLQAGQYIYLDPPSAAAAAAMGISTSDLGGYFQIDSISGTDITVTALNAPTLTGTTSDATGLNLYPPYSSAEGGSYVRTREDGELQLNLSANSSSDYYDVLLNVSVVQEDGTVASSQITYRVTNNVENIVNTRYNSTAISGSGLRIQPNTTQPSLQAMLVDANGNELPKVDGVYVDQPGYLKLVGAQENYTIAIDEMDSSQLGNLSGAPSQEGTGWGFSHFFGLNDFFDANEPTATGDSVAGSAIRLAVQQRILDNPSLVTTGELKLQQQPVGGAPDYTYVRYEGDNSVAQRLAALASENVSFTAAGGLSSGDMTLSTYAGQVLAYNASLATAADDSAQSNQSLYDGFKTRATAVSGVNLDEELANTIVFQNAYSATARVVTAVNKMYEDLLQMIS